MCRQVHVDCSCLLLCQPIDSSEASRFTFTFISRHQQCHRTADMSFIQNFWTSIAQTYSMPIRTTPTSNTVPDKMFEQQDAASQQQNAAFQQLGHSYKQQQPDHSPQSQQWSPQLQYLQYPYPHSATQGSFYAAQCPQQSAGAHQQTNTYDDRFGDCVASQQSQ